MYLEMQDEDGESSKAGKAGWETVECGWSIGGFV
jgi:hypothetical protein